MDSIEEEQYKVRVNIFTRPTIGKNQRLNLVLNSTTKKRSQEVTGKIPPLETNSDRIAAEIPVIAAGEIFSCPGDLNTRNPETLATLNLEQEDIELFFNVVEQIKQRQREAKMRWEKEQSQKQERRGWGLSVK